jgi:hypothetical protein
METRSTDWWDRHPYATFVAFSAFGGSLVAACVVAVLRGRFDLGRYQRHVFTRQSNPVFFWFFVSLMFLFGAWSLFVTARHLFRFRQARRAV